MDAIGKKGMKKVKPKGKPYKGSAMIEKNSSFTSKSPKGGPHSSGRYTVPTS